MPLPSLNEQRRKDLVKVVHKLAEEGRIAIRHARTESRDRLKKLDKVSEDDVKHGEKELQKLHDDFIAKVDDALKPKKPRSWKCDDGTHVPASADELLARIRIQGGLPRHIAIIMDGNGRWAQERLMPRPFGHRSGYESSPRSRGRRGRGGAIRAVVVRVLAGELAAAASRDPRADVAARGVHCARGQRAARPRRPRSRAGELDRLTPAAASAVERVVTETEHNDRLRLNLFISYGGRAELVRAARLLAEEVQAGTLSPDQISETDFQARLYTADCPDPDLLIRTSGEQRISNFLLWQMAYAELFMSPVLWPDFGRRELFEAILDYQNRERRFGRVLA